MATALPSQRPGQAHRVHGRGQRLDQDGLAVIELVRNDVQPVGGDREEVRHPALRIAAPEELEVLAKVLPTGATLLALPARQRRLDNNALPDGHLRHTVPDCADGPDDLMAGCVRQVDERVPAVQRVGVRPAHTRGRHPHLDLTGNRTGYVDLAHRRRVVRRDDDPAHDRC